MNWHELPASFKKIKTRTNDQKKHILPPLEAAAMMEPQQPPAKIYFGKKVPSKLPPSNLQKHSTKSLVSKYPTIVVDKSLADVRAWASSLSIRDWDFTGQIQELDMVKPSSLGRVSQMQEQI